MKDKLSILITHPQIAAEWDYELNEELDINSITYGSSIKVWWKCLNNSEHNPWKAPTSNRVQGKGCPSCSGRVATKETSLASLFPDIAKQLHPTLNNQITADDITAYSTRKVWWKCLNNSNHPDWQSVVSSLTIKKGTKGEREGLRGGCYECYKIKNMLVYTHPEIAIEFKKELNTEIELETLHYGAKKAVWWKCGANSLHPAWKASVEKRTKIGRGCPYCVNQKVIKEESLGALHPHLVPEWDEALNGTLTPFNIPPGADKKIWWKCPLGVHKSHQMLAYSKVASNNGCKHCQLIGRSAREIKLAFELKYFFNIDVEEQTIHTKDKKYKVDIIISELKMIIEYDGAYWHLGKEKSDRKKTDALVSSGWKVLRIREEPLEAITPYDIFVKYHTPIKNVADQTLCQIQKIWKQDISGLDEYLLSKKPVNAKLASKYINIIPKK